jgi:hypothetical protein
MNVFKKSHFPYSIYFLKSNWSFFVTYLLVFALISCSKNRLEHLGEWKVNENGKNWSLVLSEDKTALLMTGNQVYGGENFEINGNKHSLFYEIDYSKNPIGLDFIIKKKKRK